jgi:hypothetical protein
LSELTETETPSLPEAVRLVRECILDLADA